MEKEYDYSTEKRWHPVRFPFPSYAPNGPHTFLAALKRFGYRVELWLCNDYDLSYQAEKHRLIREKEVSSPSEGDTEKDAHFTSPIYMDKLTKVDQPWFEHLKKFIDQGVDFFKQDGALQVCEHPDRLWGNGMKDEEMHNLYPLLYSQEMFEGFKQYTGRRPCCFTPAGWSAKVYRHLDRRHRRRRENPGGLLEPGPFRPRSGKAAIWKPQPEKAFITGSCYRGLKIIPYGITFIGAHAPLTVAAAPCHPTGEIRLFPPYTP